MTDAPEQLLVDDCRRGRRAAQYELYRRYERAMFGTCLRMCRTRQDAEDVLQASFADAFAKLDHFRADATLGAWLKRIVINNCLNHLKRRRLRLDELGEEHGHTATDEPQIVYDPEPAYDVDDVKRAVADLADGYRTVLTLYLFEGLDHAEIGEYLGISEQTSKSQYSRARKRLREALTQTKPS